MSKTLFEEAFATATQEQQVVSLTMILKADVGGERGSDLRAQMKTGDSFEPLKDRLKEANTLPIPSIHGLFPRGVLAYAAATNLLRNAPEPLRFAVVVFCFSFVY